MKEQANNKEPRIIQQLAKRVRKEFLGEGTGHDWWHIERVWKMSRYIGEKEASPKKPLNMFIVEAGALLHDIADWKFQGGDETVAVRRATDILYSYGVNEQEIKRICDIIENVSFKGAGVPSKMKSMEGKIVQDADRLDAVGAIGIARAFAYGGYKKHPIHDPTIPPRLHKSFEQYQKNQTTTINHFYEKLLLLKNLLHTETAKQIAKSRQEFMRLFLKRFYQEWNGAL